MSLKTALINLAGSVGKCQENARSLKQCLELGLIEASKDAPAIAGASEIVKLWKNATPASAFAGSDVSITNSDIYDGYLIVYNHDSSSTASIDYIDASLINAEGSHYINANNINLSAGTMRKEYRSIQLTKAEGSSTVKFTFGDCKSATIATYGTGVSGSTANTLIVPIYILGVKF